MTYFVQTNDKNTVSTAPIIGIAIRTGGPYGIQIGKMILKDIPGVLGKPSVEPYHNPDNDTWKICYQSGSNNLVLSAGDVNSPVEVVELVKWDLKNE